jgi:phosphate-selective porin
MLAFLLRVGSMEIHAKKLWVTMQERAAFQSTIVESVLKDAQELHERAQQTLRKSAEALKMAKATIKLLESAIPSRIA